MNDIAHTDLSPREGEIVELAICGHTNETIAHRLHLALATVNSDWLRIRLKFGGAARPDTVARIIKDRAEKALADANVARVGLEQIVADRELALVAARSSLALLHFALDQIKSAVWATGMDLSIQILTNGKMATSHCGVVWETGKTVYEIFKSNDKGHPAIAAHLAALNGKESTVRLTGEFSNMILKAMPVFDDSHKVIGCIGIMNYVVD